ncbi:hypothetical protein HanRHA438_Chr11g0513281 [Helianthus annuus]|nr:hypothetical protein HanXRQr2_Chr11g0500511 [Helianthus annuus]KAF5782815.1 hypothetical protein HanXRQr2_Chr11g0500521 [Helianthus annuus]KAJ0502266.1 hypothetical protein HanHA300_Chr11g0410821 [Helianthus annuus]KAJ0502267.1 hypothetical protein HanHA300_Chr11g0410831 [Helianthus annuus]KAJ0510277.1 hypothetical protein HanIR_Chr11g0538861 [Helianthus annuus]
MLPLTITQPQITATRQHLLRCLSLETMWPIFMFMTTLNRSAATALLRRDHYLTIQVRSPPFGSLPPLSVSSLGSRFQPPPDCYDSPAPPLIYSVLSTV